MLKIKILKKKQGCRSADGYCFLRFQSQASLFLIHLPRVAVHMQAQ